MAEFFVIDKRTNVRYNNDIIVREKCHYVGICRNTTAEQTEQRKARGGALSKSVCCRYVASGHKRKKNIHSSFIGKMVRYIRLTISVMYI